MPTMSSSSSGSVHLLFSPTTQHQQEEAGSRRKEGRVCCWARHQPAGDKGRGTFPCPPCATPIRVSALQPPPAGSHRSILSAIFKVWTTTYQAMRRETNFSILLCTHAVIHLYQGRFNGEGNQSKDFFGPVSDLNTSDAVTG